tara:strand:+ start:447 stop:914 length:468 start_codon:yes stop_codon:yes gene_type:complete
MENNYNVPLVEQQFGGVVSEYGEHAHEDVVSEEVILELRNTEQLQFQSLLNFARHIGYFFNEDKQNFEWVGIEKTSRKFVRFQTMVAYHNSNLNHMDWRGGTDLVRWADRTNLTLAMRTAAVHSKLVSQVKLHLNKKKRKLVVNSHLVRYSKGSI